MIEYTLESADNSYLDDWFVFTDKYTDYNTHGIIRPPEMSGGEKNSIFIWLPYAVENYEFRMGFEVDTIMLLQPTSPLRTANDINNAIMVYKETETKSLYSGYYFKLKQKDKRYNKTDRPHFQRNGAIFMTDRKLLMSGKLWDDDVIEFVMPEIRSIDVDTKDDLFMCECLIKGGILNGCV